MGIQEDAGMIIAFIYKKYVENKDFGLLPNFDILPIDITKDNGWELPRVQRALKYLHDSKLIELTWLEPVGLTVTQIFPLGIEIVENEKKFKRTFGFSINLGIINLNWPAREKERK